MKHLKQEEYLQQRWSILTNWKVQDLVNVKFKRQLCQGELPETNNDKKTTTEMHGAEAEGEMP